MMEQDDELPFDELDPCCQKELQANRRRAELEQRLRRVDLSARRERETRDVLRLCDSTLAAFCGTCGQGCGAQEDYPALAALRLRLGLNKKTEAETYSEKQRDRDSDRPRDNHINIGNTNSINRSHSDSDVDSDLDGDFDIDIPLTDYERQRLDAAEKRQSETICAKSSGLAVHVEDSLNHILQLALTSVPLVLHFYQPHSELCAGVDLVIEQRVCEQFLGTRFRRIRYLSAFLTDSQMIERNWTSHLSSEGTLLCILNGNVVKSINKLEELGDHFDDIHRNLLKTLEYAHVLNSELPPLSILRNNLIIKEDEMLDAEIEKFCDDPDCVKRYKHEHVGSRSAGGSTPSFLQANAKGSEALAKNAMLRL